MKAVMCFKIKGYSSVKEELLWLLLKLSVADFEYFKQSIGTMTVLVNFTNGLSVSRLSIIVHGPLLSVS